MSHIYVTEHIHSRVVSTAFAEGSKWQTVPPLRLLDGPACVYGILRDCGKIIKECQWTGRDFYHIDLGYFKRGHYEGYYRVSKNGFQVGGGQIHGYQRRPERWEALKIELKPWRRKGRHVVVCPISGAFGEFLGIEPEKWTAATVAQLSKHTDRSIIVQKKGKDPLIKVLEDSWCLVTYNSNAAVDAA